MLPKELGERMVTIRSTLKKAGVRKTAVSSVFMIAASAVGAHAQTQSPTSTAAPMVQSQAGTDATAVQPASPWSRFYGGIEYLHWWVKDAPLSVPLVSTGPDANKEGFLINSNSRILYGAPFSPAVGGNDQQSFPGFNGSRLTVGYWLDDQQRYAIEASGFLLQSQSTTFQVRGDSSGEPGLRVPVFNTVPYAPGGGCDPERPGFCLVPQTEDGVPLAVPGDLTGGVKITNSLQLGGFDVVGVMPVYRDKSWEISALGGGSFLQLNESFNLTADLEGLPTSDLYAGQSGYAIDEFKTRNRFYGATIGMRGRYTYGPAFIEGTGRLSLGASQEMLTVNGGYADFGAPFANSSGPYGIFAMPSNEGTFTRTHFAVVPEVELKIGYNITPSIVVTVGYDFLFDSNVIRPGEQIDRNIPKGQTFQQTNNPTSLTSPARLFNTTTFFAQGITVGLTFKL
jgi:hypothetical protein